jgi:hypothetical protein
MANEERIERGVGMEASVRGRAMTLTLWSHWPSAFFSRVFPELPRDHLLPPQA